MQNYHVDNPAAMSEGRHMINPTKEIQMSNEKKMSLEEKLVQRIKSDTLMAAIGDEDMLTELVRRALHEALFQERTISTGYPTKKEQSLVIKEAKEIAKNAITEVAKEMFDEIISKPEVRETINKAMPNMIIGALKSAMAFGVSNVITSASHEAESNIRTAIQNNQI
jgi:adenylate kinase family enzyme